MTAMSPSLEAALLASLQNAEHAWTVLAEASHEQDAVAGLSLEIGALSLNTGGDNPQTVTGSPVSVTGPATPARVTLTYQLQSDPLDLTIIGVAYIVGGVFEDLDIYYRGSSFSTDSVAIYNQIAAMALPEIETVQSEFEALLKKKQADASASAALSISASGSIA